MPDIGIDNCEVEILIDPKNNEILKKMLKKLGLELNICLYGRLDGLIKLVQSLIENKFGQWNYDQSQVDESEQVSFYSLLYYCHSGALPRKIHFNAANSRTGAIKSFPTKRSIRQLEFLLRKVCYVCECIEAGKWK